MKHKSLIVIGLIGATAMTACGTSGSSSAVTTAATVTTSVGTNPEPAGSPASSGAVQPNNDADVQFAQAMIPHHQQAVTMAQTALDPAKGASADVQALATRIKGAQDPEIELMTGWLSMWDASMTMDSSAGHDMSGMGGMMSADDLTTLDAARGAEFDKLWLTMMIEHHTGAIAMSETETASGKNPDALALAQTIIAAQQSEIDEMNLLLGTPSLSTVG